MQPFLFHNKSVFKLINSLQATGLIQQFLYQDTYC